MTHQFMKLKVTENLFNETKGQRVDYTHLNHHILQIRVILPIHFYFLAQKIQVMSIAQCSLSQCPKRPWHEPHILRRNYYFELFCKLLNYAIIYN